MDQIFKQTRWWILQLIVLLWILSSAGCKNQGQELQGYIEGRFTYISANFAGVLQQLLVSRGDQVKAGQLLLVLEPQPESDSLKQAQEKVEQASAAIIQNEARLAFANLTLRRRVALNKQGAIQEESVDSANTDVATLSAQLKQDNAALLAAEAELTQAQWSKGQKTILAPKSAFVFDTYYLPGELVAAQRPILALLTPQDIKVIFFIAESQLSKLALGQTVQVTCDGCPQTISARIDFISPHAEYTPPVIYSNDTRAKLVFRIEAIPTLRDASRLHPGQPVSVWYQPQAQQSASKENKLSWLQ